MHQTTSMYCQLLLCPLNLDARPPIWNLNLSCMYVCDTIRPPCDLSHDGIPHALLLWLSTYLEHVYEWFFQIGHSAVVGSTWVIGQWEAHWSTWNVWLPTIPDTSTHNRVVVVVVWYINPPCCCCCLHRTPPFFFFCLTSKTRYCAMRRSSNVDVSFHSADWFISLIPIQNVYKVVDGSCVYDVLTKCLG